MRSTQRRPRRRPLLAVGLALALLAGACTSDTGSDASSPTTATGAAPDSGDEETTTTEPGPVELTEGDFYAVPDPLPEGEHGTLIRYQEVSPTSVAGAVTYRVMYRSESLEGDPIAVTGIVVVPEGDAPAGGRPLLTVAHGTTGVADECAPSKEPGGELGLASSVTDEGWLVAVTDYEGLGTPGRHPYLVGESEGRSAVDAILAAGQLPNADPGQRLAVAGYSQGGHGALWAGQVAEEWAPDLDLVGTFAGAPATEMGLILLGAPTGFLFLIVAGFGAAYPEAEASTFLTPTGVERLSAVDEGCTGDVFGAVSDVAKSDLVQDGAHLKPPWPALAEANDPGRVKTPDPILVIHSAADSTVPIALSDILVQRMCGLGQAVERRVLTAGEDHVGAAPGAYRDGLDWLKARMDDEPLTTDSCPTG